MSPSNWRQQEEDLVQRLPEFYLAQLGHTPEQIDCRITDNQVVITIAGAITQPEKLLDANHQTPLVQDLRAGLDQVLRTKLRAWIEEQLQVQVVDLLVNTEIDQDRMMAIAVLTHTSDSETSDRSP